MKIKKLSLIVLSVLMAFAICAFAACSGDEDGTYTPGDEVGSYYCVVDGKEANLTLTKEGTVTLKLGDEDLVGTFSLSEAKRLVAIFGDSVDMSADISYANDVITLLFRTKEYRFLRDVNYTVKFDSDGGSEVADKQVRNGKTLSKPADPVKEGMTFIGWYKDKEFKEPYQFGSEAVTGDMTLYACYAALSGDEKEFSVTYNPNYDGATVTTAKTTDGIADTTAPVREGYTFVGWFVSDYDDAEKLTYQYNGEVLYQNTVLFAVWKSDVPVVSVKDGKITWNNLGIGSYTVYVYKADGTLASDDASKTVSSAYEWEFNFNSLNAGEYKIQVSYKGKTGYSYYKNKALAKVSLFKVVNGTILTYNAVPGAEEYLITVDCGNKAHKHTGVSNGTSLTYNFANCEMQKGGIKFTVKATKQGYLTSVSETYVFEQGLEAVEDLKVVEDDEKATWSAVENATSYKVAVTYNGKTETYYVTAPELSLKNYGKGEISVEVTPLADNYYSPEAKSVSYTKETLASPVNVRLSSSTTDKKSYLMWDAVEGAKSYTVLIGNTTYETATNSLELSESYFAGTDWTVAVMVTTASASSSYSDPVSVSSVAKLTEDMVYYKDGKVYWGNVFGATHYRVDIDNRNELVSASEPHSLELGFTTPGEHTVKVTAVGYGTGVTLKLQVYEVVFNSNDGTDVSALYVAEGDYLKLPESVKGGYDFIGWYNAIDGAASGKKYNDGTFTLNNNVTLYAGWNPKTFKVTMNWANGEEEGTLEDEVSYMTQYRLPTPEYTVTTNAFYGWYLGSIRYTDENGDSLYAYDRISEVTLEAKFVEVLNFELNETLQEGETEKSYYVEKGEYINLLTEVYIPETYNGKRVTVINGSAFASATKLVKIKIPDTIKYIFIGQDGVNATGSAFQSCSSLAEFEIYETDTTEGEKGPYWTKDGVMYQSNGVTGAKEIYAVPYAKLGSVTIDDEISTISQGIFASSKITSVTIPATVTTIEKNAFKSNSNLTSVVFESPAEGEEGAPLTIADEAFYSCSNLLEITLPTRLQAFSGSMFRLCSKLANVYFTDDNGKYISKDGVVMETNENDKNLTLVYYPAGKEGAYAIPSDVTAIAESAFCTKFKKDDYTDEKPSYTYTGATKLTSIEIPSNVTYIGKYAFRGCTGITSVTFEGGLNDLTIESFAFYGLTNTAFTTVTLPENLVKLGANAFGGCTKLITVNLNSKDCSKFETAAFGSEAVVPAYYVTTLNIGKETSAVEIAGVFGKKLVEVNVDKDNPNYTVTDNVVYDYDVTTLLFYPVEKEGEYKTPDTLTTIGANVFNGRTKLTKVTIGKNITKIGDSAFYGCTALATVVFDDNRDSDLVFGDEVFRNCSSLTEISLPEKTTEVGSMMFYSCPKLVTVNLPTTLTSIADGYDTILKKNIFNMFYGYKTYALEAINVAKGNPKYASVDGILFGAVDGTPTDLLFCPSAKIGTVDLPKTTASIASKAFMGSQVTAITFSEGIDPDVKLTFGEQAFYSSQLQSIQLPEGLTEIFDKMFYWCDTLVNVTIPSTVTSIGSEAFYYCKLLESINIPKSVSYIGLKAFSSCYALKTVTFEEESEKNDDGSYKNPLVISDGYSSDGYYYGVFSNAPVTELIFPDRTTYIGSYLMGYSSYYGSTTYNAALKKVVIPSTIEYIGQYAFYYCKGLEYVEFKGEGVSKLKSGSFKQKFDTSTTASAQEYHYGLYGTFGMCSALKTLINLPETSEKDGYDMTSTFTYSALKDVEIPATVSSMSSAFNYSPDIEKVTFRKGSILKTLKQSFSKCTKLTSIELPDGLETIGNNALGSSLSSSYATGLTSIVIPKTVKTIEYGAFMNLPNLTKVTFATYTEGENAGKCDIEKIQYKAFANTGITSFEFPVSTADSVELGKGTDTESNKGRLFYNCINLTEVTLSKSITDIDYVFKDAPNLKIINIASDNTSFATVSGKPYVYSYDSTKTNNVGSAILFVFGTPDVDKDGKLTIETGITEISAYAFESQKAIKSVTIPYTLEKLGAGAFINCTNLTSVTFEHSAENPSALKSANVGTYVFSGCTSLETVTLPNGVGFTAIPQYMFNGSAIKSITIPSKVTSIGNYAFQNCDELTSIEIPANVTSIGNYAFDGCTKLATLTFESGSKLTSIGTYAFRKADIKAVVIPSKVTKIGSYAFVGNENLASITFDKNDAGKSALTTIDTYAFGYSSIGNATYGNPCLALTSVVIPKSVTTIGNFAFANCTGLQSVTFEEGSGLTTLGSNVFMNTALTEITLPKSLKTINTKAFLDCKSLTSVNFEEGSLLTTLGAQFLAGTNVQSFTLPSSVQKIADGSFVNATSLSEIKLNDGLTTIGGYAFYNCQSLTSIDIPDTVKTFGTYCFSGCINLKSVNFGENSALTTFGTYMFSNYTGSTAPYKDVNAACTSLKSLAVPDGVTALGNYMFKNCTALTEVTFGENSALTFLGTYTFQASGLKKIEVPSGVTMIGTAKTTCSATGSVYTFADCADLTDVTFKGKITKIGGYVFYNCTSLKLDVPEDAIVVGSYSFANTANETITVPKGLTVANLGTATFAYNKNLTEIKVATGSKAFKEDASGALLTSDNKLVCFPAGKSGAVSLPDGVTINGYAFAGCDKVTSVTLPENVTLANYAFKDATGLKSITIPASVEKLGTTYAVGYMFDGCTSLESVTLKGNVTLIGGYTFRNCSSLTSINLPDSLETIGYGAFQGTAIKEFTFKDGIEYKGTSASYATFKDSALQKATIQTNSLITYLLSGASKLTEVVIESEITSIPNYAFQNCTSLEKFTIPETVTTIGDGAFYGCTALTSITIPNSVTSIGQYAFTGCTALTSVNFGTGLKTVGNSVFNGCTALTSITIPDGVETMGNYVFQNCTALKSVVLPDSVTSIGTYFFNGCESLTSVKLGKGITALPNYVFQNCTGLTEFTVPETVETFGTATFKGCSNLKTVTLSGQTIISINMFLDCTSLEEVKNTETIVEIANYAFSGCTALKKLNIPNVETFGIEIFANCTSLTKLVVEKIPTAFKRDIFNGWTADQTIYFCFSEEETVIFDSAWYDDCQAKVVWNYTVA